MRKDARLLIERLTIPEWGVPFRPDQMHLMSLPGAESWGGCHYMASLLFSVIRDGMTGKAKREIAGITEERAKQWGDYAARSIFATLGRPPTARQAQQFRNDQLLDRLENMPEPNVSQLAREVAEENKLLPRDQQRGAGGTDERQLDQQIRRLVRSRKRNRSAAE
jgi:hypothetical protein